VTCYFRHLQGIFEKAGIEVTEANEREVDKVIHEIVGIKYEDCPAVWKEVKKRIGEDKESFISELEQEWRRHS
jgi:hypothetical protein